MDGLIGSNFPATASKKPKQHQLSPSLSPSPLVALSLTSSSYRRTPSSNPPPSSAVVALGQKRPAADDSFMRRSFSAAMAAAAAAAPTVESESEEEEDEPHHHQQHERDNNDKDEEIRRLARATEKFGEVYERVEREKLRQMVDLEKQRMKFAKDVEMKRMRVFTETQIQLEKIKTGKRSGPNEVTTLTLTPRSDSNVILVYVDHHIGKHMIPLHYDAAPLAGHYPDGDCEGFVARSAVALLREVQVLRSSLHRASVHFAPRRYKRVAHIVANQALLSLV